MKEGLPNSAGSCRVELQVEDSNDTPQQKTSLNVTFLDIGNKATSLPQSLVSVP